MKKYVKVRFDVQCIWKKIPPIYRIYVNDEMFTERTFIWDKNTYIKEMLQIKAEPGIYEFRLVEIGDQSGNFTISNRLIEVGDAKISSENKVEIL